MSQTFSFEEPTSPFRLEAAVVETFGEAEYAEPEVPDRELELFESLQADIESEVASEQLEPAVGYEEVESPADESLEPSDEEFEATADEYEAYQPADEYEAADAYEPAHEALEPAGDEDEYAAYRPSVGESEAEHPVTRFFRVPLAAVEALGKGSYAAALTLLGAVGHRSENDLTNVIFYFRHPDVLGRKIQPDERDLQREWIHIRDTIVRPTLQRRTASVSSPDRAGRSSIPSSGLRWYGPGEATPELLTFLRAVYERQVTLSEGAFVDTLPKSALRTIEGEHRARIPAADAAIRMVAAARADLVKEGQTGVAVGITSAYRSADEQFAIWQGKGHGGKRGFPHYYRITAEQRRATGDEHGPAAVNLLAKVMKKWIAAPGYSNHQDGLALDLGTAPEGKPLGKIGRRAWFHRWLVDNAERFDFRPYTTETWHWVYRPKPTGSAEEAAWRPDELPALVSADDSLPDESVTTEADSEDDGESDDDESDSEDGTEYEEFAPEADLAAVAVRSENPVENDRLHVDPRYGCDQDDVVPPVWLLSDRLRALLRQKSHDSEDRAVLQRAVERQLRTATMYDIVRQIVAHATSPGRLTVYALLFPGEARDNTGIKDLNDKVLGYTLQQQYIARRHEEIKRIFHPQFVVAGQDYKIAVFVTWEQNRPEYDRRLHQLDQKLRELLLKDFLPRSTKEGAKELRRVLEKNPDYRFDVYYGMDTLEVGVSGQQVLTAVHLLLTQALKAAAVGRYIAKGQSTKARVARRFGENASPDRKVDPRGKAFGQAEFLKVASAAPAIKAFMLKAPIEHTPVSDYNTIYVDTVWTQAFYPRQSTGDRDMIRAVRKKDLQKPSLPNVKYTFAAQKELLELWLVTLNLVDFIKDFLDREFTGVVVDQHDRAVQVLDNLRDAKRPVDRERTERFLTEDVRTKRLAVLGTASEYQYYAEAADHDARILFVLDVVDLGVEVMSIYDRTNAKILDERLAGERLMHETFRCTDGITQLRRSTHELVVTTFRRYHELLKRGDGTTAARAAFGTAPAKLGDFADDVQIMLGGDEIMVAAHPRFAAYVANLVADLSATAPGPAGTSQAADAPHLRIRAGVAFSAASASGERKARQLAHNQAMCLADESHGLLKALERRHRRIERLLVKLDAIADKRSKVPEYRRQLDALRLDRLFTRVKFARPVLLPKKRADALVRAWRQGDWPTVDTDVAELVGHDGKVVDRRRLLQAASNLEASVRKDVGKANIHIDPPPAVKIPAPKPDKDDTIRTLLRPLLTPFRVPI
ncbi:D-alanyl-D-alanine carboxypeptidase-like protein [Kribbella orskensis]|uniref:D-alanyl-D-alanine carboxypeptidase-like protein n=1 Tax=Kribbella orskensis TaxID=2512216 RepID=A0ABY2BNM1_9ACTN|nr:MULTISPECIES: M15 family metallopeptidase [Kribbella]TCN41818.1 D-alanyl-D-alanine carboxypeptidase-like protein [Kribbella sp. VKM Ac-2500]TCO25696.1 D-alanyl-D-alanine carboxypeptidase-like protein [Kribbella orskensis]